MSENLCPSTNSPLENKRNTPAMFSWRRAQWIDRICERGCPARLRTNGPRSRQEVAHHWTHLLVRDYQAGPWLSRPGLPASEDPETQIGHGGIRRDPPVPPLGVDPIPRRLDVMGRQSGNLGLQISSGGGSRRPAP